MMRVLKEAEFYTEAEPILRQIFVKDDPFGESFSPNIPVRRIIYEYSYRIKSPLLDAVVAAASLQGDTGFYLSSLWRDNKELIEERPHHWYIPFSEIEFYKSRSRELEFVLISENVLYSPQGKWGIMMSHERYGILGGSSEFVSEISQRIPDFKGQVYGFLNYWKYWKEEKGTKINWLPKLLAHIYGKETASNLLIEGGLYVKLRDSLFN